MNRTHKLIEIREGLMSGGRDVVGGNWPSSPLPSPPKAGGEGESRRPVPGHDLDTHLRRSEISINRSLVAQASPASAGSHRLPTDKTSEVEDALDNLVDLQVGNLRNSRRGSLRYTKGAWAARPQINILRTGSRTIQ